MVLYTCLCVVCACFYSFSCRPFPAPAKTKARSYTTPLDLDIGTSSTENASLAVEKSSLSESIKSDASDSTVIEEDTTMRRTYTICTADRPSSHKSVRLELSPTEVVT